MPAEVVFEKISNFNNLSSAFPKDVTNYKVTADSISFDIPGMTTMAMQFKERNPYTSVVVESIMPTPFKFELQINIDKLDEEHCTTQVVINADLPVFVAAMAKKPLEKLVETINGGIKLS